MAVDWSNVMQRYKNSVLQLLCIRASYKPFRPQLTPQDKSSAGTGFIIDILNGLVLTNAHVVANALAITGKISRLGDHNLTLRLISICQEKDLALCQLSQTDQALILQNHQPAEINLTFGDDLLLQETDLVMTIGYPLGEKNIKFTSGMVSGFFANAEPANNDFLTEEEHPSYIQVTAPINPGNSGGPLLNKQGQVVGINAAGYLFFQNIGYAIGTRIFLSVYQQLLAPLVNQNLPLPYLVKTPKYAFTYQQPSATLIAATCAEPRTGLYLNTIYDNTAFSQLKDWSADDLILFGLECQPNYQPLINLQVQVAKLKIQAELDQYGFVQLNQQRRLSLKELFDLVPSETVVTLSLCRNHQGTKEIKTISQPFVYQASSIRTLLYPSLEPYQYGVLAGLSIGELTLNHLAKQENCQLVVYGQEHKRYQPILIVNQVLPNTVAYQTNVFKEGTIIKEVNGQLVKTLAELKAAVEAETEQLVLVSQHNLKLMVNRAEAKQADMEILDKFSIPLSHYLL